MARTDRQPQKPKKGSQPARQRGISEHEVEDVEEMSTPRTPVIYEVVRRLGEEEMERPLTSLWWSGLAAGLSISFSLLAQAILREHLPDAPWRVLIAGFGYSVGFLIVILGRQQLFTESTITAVLPVLKDLNAANLWRMGRLWAIVLTANLAGTLFAALFCTYFPVDPARPLRRHARHQPRDGGADLVADVLARRVVRLPDRDDGVDAAVGRECQDAGDRADDLADRGRRLHAHRRRQHGGLLLVLAGDWEWWRLLGRFFAPVLLGNMVGGTALFALISYAQVMEEI